MYKRAKGAFRAGAQRPSCSSLAHHVATMRRQSFLQNSTVRVYSLLRSTVALHFALACNQTVTYFDLGTTTLAWLLALPLTCSLSRSAKSLPVPNYLALYDMCMRMELGIRASSHIFYRKDRLRCAEVIVLRVHCLYTVANP